ncbi:hypothetical protein N7495_007507 [Penicillium taxi]|uniref:uncharacterized protein n=1 Tax=Penicillium taxi TaxID=168475 RepID=UPI0025457C8C|nr:uncharacterized protein N7495_007507 [Penicillium taxi]KAJ5887466.1 hypothetical protein N7495_007507 [Penicillium taxi]
MITYVDKTARIGLLVARRSTLPKSTWRVPVDRRFISTITVSANDTTPAVLTPPLATLPASVLLRSLLIATISSKPFLLDSSLWAISILSKPDRGFLFNVDRNPILHSILKNTFYNQFCAGENGTEVKATIRQLKDMGFRGVIMTYAKETVFDRRTSTKEGPTILDAENDNGLSSSQAVHCDNIDSWRKGTLETIEQLEDGDYLAVKLTGAGPTVTEAFAAVQMPPKQMLVALKEICNKCKDRNVRLLVDAESQHFQWGIMRITLELMQQYNRDGFAVVYNTYQAYLKSTSDTLASHLVAAQKEGFTLGLKLVRGAYIASDNRSLIHDTKEETDTAYNDIAQGALRHNIGEFGISIPFPSLDLLLCSHNRASVMAAHQLHEYRVAAGLPTVPVEFAQLHGMSDEVSFSLLQSKGIDGAPQVYKCSTWGSLGECLAYLLRRAIENRDAVLRTNDEYTALKTELKRRLRGTVYLYSGK